MGKLAIEDENPKELKVFRKLVMKKMVKPWDDTKDIKLAVYDTLSDFMHNKELIGWIRGDNAVNSVVIADEIARLTKENSELRLSNENIQKDNAIRYNGQTFETLRDHLTSINIENLNSNGQLESLSLYNMFIDKGHLFTDGTPSIDSKFEALLLLYKIIKRIGKENISRKLVNGILPDRYWTTYSCYFTDDGHNFYLECLTRNKITNPLHVSINKLLDSTGISTSNSED